MASSPGSWTPFTADETNLRHIAMQCDVQASFSKHDGTCETISFCTLYPLAPSGVRVDLWCYGNKLTSHMAVAHLYFLLKNITSLPLSSGVKISLALMLSDDVDKQEVQSYFSNDTLAKVAITGVHICENVTIDQPINR